MNKKALWPFLFKHVIIEMMKYDKSKINKEAYRKAAENATSNKSLCKELGYEVGYGESKRIADYLKEKYPEIKRPNWKGQKSNKGNYKMERFAENTKFYSNMINTLKRIRGEKCENCGLSDWNGKKITLEVHHKDGDRSNNTLENLQVLCPNCHSQTKNWRRGNKKKLSDEEIIKLIPQSYSASNLIDKAGYAYSKHLQQRINKIKMDSQISFKKRESKKRESKKIAYCSNCGKVISSTAKLCAICLANEKREGLLKRIGGKENFKKILIENEYNLTAVAKIFGVSDNSVKKWCKSLKLPFGKYSQTEHAKNAANIEKEELLQKYKELKTIKGLSIYFKTTRDRIRTLLKKSGAYQKTKT